MVGMIANAEDIVNSRIIAIAIVFPFKFVVDFSSFIKFRIFLFLIFFVI